MLGMTCEVCCSHVIVEYISLTGRLGDCLTSRGQQVANPSFVPGPPDPEDRSLQFSDRRQQRRRRGLQEQVGTVSRDNPTSCRHCILSDQSILKLVFICHTRVAAQGEALLSAASALATRCPRRVSYLCCRLRSPATVYWLLTDCSFLSLQIDRR